MPSWPWIVSQRRCAPRTGPGLGRYVREQHALSPMDALRKMTVMPTDCIGLKNKRRIRYPDTTDY